MNRYEDDAPRLDGDQSGEAMDDEENPEYDEEGKRQRQPDLRKMAEQQQREPGLSSAPGGAPEVDIDSGELRY